MPFAMTNLPKNQRQINAPKAMVSTEIADENTEKRANTYGITGSCDIFTLASLGRHAVAIVSVNFTLLTATAKSWKQQALYSVFHA